MDKIAIVAEVISFIGMLIFLYSTTIKSKKKFLLVQNVFFIVDTVVWILKNGFSAVIQNVVGIIRNLFVYYNKQTKTFDIVFIVLSAVIGILVVDWKNFVVFDLFPIISNIEFSVVMLKTKNIKYVKGALIVSSLLWAIYGLYNAVFVTFVFNTISCIVTIITLIILIKKEKNNINN